MLSYYKFSSSFLFGGCSGQIYKLVFEGGRVSAIPYADGRCVSSDTIGLHCSNSK